MGLWQDRGFIYKVGFVGVIIGALLFVVGFCAPSWAFFRAPYSTHQTQSMGLWLTCTGDLEICAVAVDEDNPGWLKAVRALECISMFFAVAACIVGLYCNCILKAQFTNIFNKNMETSAIVSVVFGVFGLIIFSTQVHNFYTSHVGHISWGFVLVCVSNAFIGISAFLMLISHKLRFLADQAQYSHHQFNDSFHTQVQLPDYSAEAGSQAFITVSEGYIDFGPPAYETVVNCIPQDEAAPPPYAQVVKDQEEAH